jgi:hypothetical protein
VPRRRVAFDALAALAIGAYCLVRYGDCVLTFFFHDDFWILRDAALLDEGPARELWRMFRPSHVGFILYRPLTQVGYFYALRQLFGVDASGYHASQLFFFGLDSILLYALARRLAESRAAGLATAIVYAAAPGHAVAVFWVAAFTMTGSATVVFLMLWWWLVSGGARRAVGCALLQAAALLCSEHCVVGPMLLAAVARFSPRPPRWRSTVRDLLPAALLVAAYVLAKTLYLLRSANFGYEMGIDPVSLLGNLGRYAAASFDLLKLAALGPAQLTAVGVAVVAIVAWAVRQTLRGRDSWRLVALGGSLFVLALAPVLPLRDHHFDYFVGIAAAGAALAVVGACRLAGRHWRAVAAAVAVAVLATGAFTLERAARDDPHFRLVTYSARGSAQWLTAIERTQAAVVYLPRNPMTYIMFRMGNAAARLLPAGAPIVRLFPPGEIPRVGPGEALLGSEPTVLRLGEPLPGWNPRWQALRTIVPAPRRLYCRALRPIGTCAFEP